MTGDAARFVTTPIRVVNLGLELFAQELEGLGIPVIHVDWRPPTADAATLDALERLEARREAIDLANASALDRLVNGEPFLVDCRPAREALELPDRTVLHAGPPLDWTRMCGPLRGAVCAAIVYEGWAGDLAAAEALVERGGVRFAPNHHFGAVGPSRRSTPRIGSRCVGTRLAAPRQRGIRWSTGGDVPALEGIDAPTAWTIRSELGRDMGRWPTVQHGTWWLGRGPHYRVSAGTV